MEATSKFPSMFHLLLLILIPHCHCESDHTALVYHYCTNKNNKQTATSTSMSQTALSSLMEALITESTNNSSFHRASSAQNGIPVWAEYQCRGDMSSHACQSCVTRSGILSNRLCAGAEEGRVQLRGCYVRYEADGELGEEVEKGKLEVLHKRCGEWEGGGDDDGAVWAAVEEGIVRSGSGFCEARNVGGRAVAQCQGGLLGCDCAECVSGAVEVLREECQGRLAGDVYLNGCYVTYTTNTYTSGYKKNGSSGKLVAIMLGGAASLGIGFILLMFFKSCGKKDDD